MNERVTRRRPCWTALAGDLDEAATLNPTTTHEQAVAIAALTGKPQLIPHQTLNGNNNTTMDSAAAMAQMLKKSGGDVSVRSVGWRRLHSVDP